MIHERSLPITRNKEEVSVTELSGIDAKKSAILFPGMGYTCDRPLLYYTTEILLNRGYNVFLLEYKFSKKPDWKSKSKEERFVHARRVVEDCFEEIKGPMDPKNTIWVGKSLGTYLMACLLENHPAETPEKIVWLTPAMDDKWSFLKELAGKSLSVIGTADPFFEANKGSLPDNAVLVEGADHSLEKEGPLQSLDILKDILKRLDAFLE